MQQNNGKPSAGIDVGDIFLDRKNEDFTNGGLLIYKYYVYAEK